EIAAARQLPKCLLSWLEARRKLLPDERRKYLPTKANLDCSWLELIKHLKSIVTSLEKRARAKRKVASSSNISQSSKERHFSKHITSASVGEPNKAVDELTEAVDFPPELKITHLVGDNCELVSSIISYPT
ncbi:unnamed protein product, partial [Protopolystoma xenopodis]